MKNIKTAIVHDWLTTYGGGERVVEVFARLFPDAPLYTTIYDKKSLGHLFPPERVRTSYMQKIPGVTRHYKKMLRLMPRAFEEFDLSGYDLVLSSSSSCAKGVLTGANCTHISYIHSPMRYAWDLYPEYLSQASPLVRWGMRRQMPGIRQWDALTGNRVDEFLANSREVAARIEKVYRRKAAVLHPPIETDFYTPSPAGRGGDYYLVLSRFIPYKRIDLAIKACNRLGRKLVIIGSGPQEKELRKLAGPTVTFTGFISNEDVLEYYRNCRAFLFPGFEDFGMTPVEAQACGRPIVAFGEGGALDSVLPGKTGVFFPRQTVESLMEGMEELESRSWDGESIRRHAERFSASSFEDKLMKFIDITLKEKNKREYTIL